MLPYQQSFIEFALARNALRFGSFTLKSGRQSPYFFNTGVFDSGSALRQLGEAYASALVASGLEFDMLFGPAYKGIPLGAAIAIALATITSALLLMDSPSVRLCRPGPDVWRPHGRVRANARPATR